MGLYSEFSSTRLSTRVPVYAAAASCCVLAAVRPRHVYTYVYVRVCYPGEKTLKSLFEQSITSEIQEGDEPLRIVVLTCGIDGLDNALCNATIARYSQVRTSTPVLVCVFSVVCGYARVHGTASPQRVLVLGQPYNPCTAYPVNVESDINVM